MKVKVVPSGQELNVNLVGNLDEKATEALTSLAIPSNVTKVTFDVGDVAWVNSYGSAKWIRFLKAIPATVEYVFERCPESIMGMAVIMPDMVARGRIQSLILTFSCKPCRTKQAAAFDRAAAAKFLAAPPTMRCPKCDDEVAPSASLADYMNVMKLAE